MRSVAAVGMDQHRLLHPGRFRALRGARANPIVTPDSKSGGAVMFAGFGAIRWKTGLRSLFLIVSGVLIVTLALEIRRLRPYITELNRRRAFPFAGQWVPAARVAGLVGDSVTIGESRAGRNQVLIFFNVVCPFCEQTLPAWKQLSDRLMRDSGSVEVYWISGSSPDSTAEYVRRHGVTARVVLAPDRKTMRIYRVRGVPMTLVLSPDGAITHVRPAVMTAQVGIDSIVAAALRRDSSGLGRSAGTEIPSRASGRSSITPWRSTQ
jgi:peroxiredoxin